MTLHTQINPEEVSAHVQALADRRRKTYDPKLADEASSEDRAAKTVPAPKFQMREHGVLPSTAEQIVRTHLLLDGKPGLNLASFVSTEIDQGAINLAVENITKNLADSDEYPALVEIQQRCVSIISNLWNVPKGERGVGTATTGSSEAIHLGGLAMKRRWEASRKAAGKSIAKPNIIMGANAQVALEKFARYFDVEARILDVTADAHFSFTMDDLRKNIDENTIGVFAILGSTYTGHYQNIAEINGVLDEFEKETGIDIPIHVDGASGAFVAPFVTPDLEWDFRIPRVKSINTSGHKFGLAPVGCGWIIWRDQKYLPKELLFTLAYLGGSEESYTLNFSRPGYPIIAQYYCLVKNGKKGYRDMHLSALENARLLSTYLERTGYFDVLSDIHRKKGVYYKEGEANGNDEYANAHPNDFYNPGLPVVSFKLNKSLKDKYPYIPQEAVSALLRSHGYIIPNYPLPPSEEKYECLRVVVSPRLTVDLLDQLMEDIGKVVNKLISIDETRGHGGSKQLLEGLKIISEADHNENENEGNWHHSRC